MVAWLALGAIQVTTAVFDRDWFFLALGVAYTLLGVGYFALHALPERIAHRSNSTQIQVIGILALLALFTHNHVFWIAALLLAAVRLPDVMSPLNRIAASLETRSGRDGDG